MDFVPIPELQRDDGDLYIIYLSGNGMRFSEPMAGEWYRATTPRGSVVSITPEGVSKERASYISDEAASPMGCISQWQWCNLAYPGNRGCGPLASLLDAMYQAAPLFNLTIKDLEPDRPSSSEAAGARMIWHVLTTFTHPIKLDQLLMHLGPKSLISQTRSYTGLQLPLPSNQWQLDVVHWWNSMLAGLQAAYVDNLQGNYGTEYDSFRSPPLNKEEEKWCRNQVLWPFPLLQPSSIYLPVDLNDNHFTFIFSTTTNHCDEW